MVKVKTLEKVKANALGDALDDKVVEVEVEILAETLPEMENKARVDPLRQKLVVATHGLRCRRWRWTTHCLTGLERLRSPQLVKRWFRQRRRYC